MLRQWAGQGKTALKLGKSDQTEISSNTRNLSCYSHSNVEESPTVGRS